MIRHAKYPRRPRRVAPERLYTGGTRSVASALERRCSACADLAKTDVATTPGIPGYATIGLCQGAGICAAPRGREGRASARPDAHRPVWPGTRSTRAALGAWRCGVSPTVSVLGGDGPLFIKCGQGQPRLRERTTRGGPWLREASAERSWSIFPGHRSFYSSRKEKRRGALMARIPPVADTDGTDLALPLEVARRSGSICVGEAGAVIPSHTSR